MTKVTVYHVAQIRHGQEWSDLTSRDAPEEVLHRVRVFRDSWAQLNDKAGQPEEYRVVRRQVSDKVIMDQALITATIAQAQAAEQAEREQAEREQAEADARAEREEQVERARAARESATSAAGRPAAAGAQRPPGNPPTRRR